MENEAIKEKVEEVPKKSMRDTLYGNLNVSVKTMDKVLVVLITLLILSLIIGVLV
ncbi:MULTISPECIES: hypothetical protein [Clostridium]|uniref:hypothetical protein n=1 Tax=Clostridium TaxID=1485 RepID=UPI001441E447|nr:MULTISPECIES: hypothetical protein [Clostridium]MBS5939675.1 hypothetical protein [Clostridium sp.]